MSQVVVVTGTSTGIGEAAALHFAREGYSVFAGMRRPEAGEALRSAADAEKLDLAIVANDVCDPASNQSLVDRAISESGKIDVLINNAGIAGGLVIEELSMEFLRGMMETNFFGAIDLIQRVVPGMRERGSGCILNVSSSAGLVSGAPTMAYSVSKSALEVASEVLAMEMKGFGVRVGIIEPGVVLTPIFGKGAEAKLDESSPYLKFYNAFDQSMLPNFMSPEMPEAVARVMQEAVETQSPKLRYLVGSDALALVKARREMSDEDWVGLGEMKEEELALKLTQMMGNDRLLNDEEVAALMTQFSGS